MNPALPQGPAEVPEGDGGVDPYAAYSDAMLAYDGGGGSSSTSGTSPTHSVSTAGGSPLSRASKHLPTQGAIGGPGSGPPHAFAPGELPPLDIRQHMGGASMFRPGTLTGDSGTPPGLPPGLHLSPHMGSLPPGSPMMSPGRAAAMAAAYAIGVTPPVTGMSGPGGGRHGSFSFHPPQAGDSSTSSGSPTARQGGGQMHSQGAPSSPTFRGMTGASRLTATGQSIPHSPRRRVPEAAVVDSSGAHVGYRYRSGSSDFVAFGAPPPGHSAPPPPASGAPPTGGGTGVAYPSALEGSVSSPPDKLHPLPGAEGAPQHPFRTRNQRTESSMSDLDLPPPATEGGAAHSSGVSPSLVVSAAPPLTVSHASVVSSAAPPFNPALPGQDPHAAAAMAAVQGGGMPLPPAMEEGSPRHKAAMAAAAAAAHAVYSGYYPGGGLLPHAPLPSYDPYAGDPYAAMRGGMYGGVPPSSMPPPTAAAAGAFNPYAFTAGGMPHMPHGYSSMHNPPPPAGAYAFYGQPNGQAAGGGYGGGYAGGMAAPPGPSPVLIVSGFNSSVITNPEQLFVLASAFGTVERIKIMFKRRDTALVQFASQQQAQIAQVHLHRCPLFGLPLKANFSSHHVVHLPQPVRTRQPAAPACVLTAPLPLHVFVYFRRAPQVRS